MKDTTLTLYTEHLWRKYYAR